MNKIIALLFALYSGEVFADEYQPITFEGTTMSAAPNTPSENSVYTQHFVSGMNHQQEQARANDAADQQQWQQRRADAQLYQQRIDAQHYGN